MKIIYAMLYINIFGRLQCNAFTLDFLFFHRHTAVRVGLGEFELNNLVIKPEYG